MKRIHVFFSIAILFFAKDSIAQQKGSSFISVGGGISLPFGNWSKTSSASSLISLNSTVPDDHGYANIGGFGELEGAWFFSNHFAVGGMIRYAFHGLRGIDSLSQSYEESFDVDTTRTYPGKYKILSFLPGLYLDLPVSKKIFFTAKVNAGVAYANSPNITVTIEDAGIFNPPVVQNAASKLAPAFDAGVGLGYKLNKLLALSIRADLFYTKPDFSISNSKRNNNAGREIYEYDQPLTSVNFSLGITYCLSKK